MSLRQTLTHAGHRESLDSGANSLGTVDEVGTLRTSLRRPAVVLVAAALSIAACSSSDGGETVGTDTDGSTGVEPAATDPIVAGTAESVPSHTPTSPDDPTARTDETDTATTTTTEAPVEFVTYAIEVPPPADVDAATTRNGEPVEYPTTPMSASQVVDFGVDQGQWTREEGVIASLRWLLQDVPLDSIPALDDVRSPSFSDLIDLADEVAASTPDAAAAAEIQSLLNRIFPPLDVLESTSVDSTSGPGATEPQGLVRRPAAAPAGSCIAVSEDAFEELTPGDNCNAVKIYDSDPVAGYRLRVFYPLEWNGTPKEEIAELTLAAMVTTTTTIDPFADIGDASLVFSRPRPDGSEGDDLGLATNANAECAITIFPTADGSTTEGFKQLIAHETVHCIQFSDMGGSGGDWVDEGGAEYFSHWLFPQGGLEKEYVSDFDTASRTTALDQLSYETWVWWQYLANRSSPQAVWELQRRISNGGSISSEADIEQLFHEFVILWAGPGFSDSAGTTIPGAEPSFSTVAVISDTGPVELPAGALVAARWTVDYEKERRFTQTRNDDGIAEVAVVEYDQRANRGEWTELESEIRSTCTEREQYVTVATSVAEQHATAVDVEVEIAACDPCLLGTWRLDNPSFDALIASIIATEGGGDFPGMFSTSGDYFLRFDEEQNWDSWRTDYAITVSSQGFEFVTRIASIERGTYGTNQEQTRLNVPTAVTVESRTTSDLPFGGGSVTVADDTASVTMFGQSASVAVPGEDGPQAAAADYTCDEDVLTVTLDDAGPGGPAIRFDRVEDIPEPPTKLPPA